MATDHTAPRRAAISTPTAAERTPSFPPPHTAPAEGEVKKKVGYYTSEELIERARAAYAATAYAEGLNSFSQFHECAIRTEVERLESKYNNGTPFPVAGGTSIPRGRPLQK